MRFLFVLLFGVALGATAMFLYDRDRLGTTSHSATVSGNSPASMHDATDRALAKTRAAASDLSGTIGEKMQAWHLTSADIRADLAKGGEVVRQNTAGARQRASDARIVAVIKAKFVLDRDLSVNAVAVESREGNVTLSGTLASDELVGRAVAHALDTDGVEHVAAKIKVAPEAK